MQTSRTNFEKLVCRTGYASLAPIIVASVVVVAGHGAIRQFAVLGLIAYCAIVVSCLGAVRLGLDLRDRGEAPEQTPAHILLGTTLPALAGFISLMLPSRAALLFLAIIFAAIYCYDRLHMRNDIQLGWFLRLRTRLSLVTIAALGVSVLAI